MPWLKRAVRSSTHIRARCWILKKSTAKTRNAVAVRVRNKSKKKDWLAIISTDTSLSEEEIIRVYGKRWDIEVFFKSCKSYLHLVKECRSLSYDALTAHVSIVFARYMMLSVAQRRNEDNKTICELFFCLVDELDDITFSQSMLPCNSQGVLPGQGFFLFSSNHVFSLWFSEADFLSWPVR